ncbi:MAG TPA: hypothetical protein VFY24_14870 [Azospira sp.]|nr:hypothetical protein [Azospira sp.]
MNDSLSASTGTDAGNCRARPLRRSLAGAWRAPLLAALLALPAAPLLADDADSEARANAISTPQAAVPWLSGGIGDEARAEMRKAAADYNVHLMFSERSGAYLADVPVTVRQRGGEKVYSGVSEGPLLYLRLPPGNYRVAAMIDGAWQERALRIGAGGRASRTSFVARGE